MNSPNVQVSIVIPTFNRSESVRQTLRALDRQTFPATSFEVVVVDDGSDDDTPEIATTERPYHFLYIRQMNQGCTVARNVGAQASQGKLVIFLDDDVTVEPEYVRELVLEHSRVEHVVGMGALYPVTGHPSSPFQIWWTRVIAPGAASCWVTFRECISNNLSIERDDFFRIGGWKDVAGDGQGLWGDVEFGYRAHRAGTRFRRCASAVCFHHDYAIQDLSTFLMRSRRSAHLVHALFQAHPELEGELPMFRDMSAPDPRKDSLGLIGRKWFRALSATTVGLRFQERLVGLAERAIPSPTVLAPLYRLIVGGHLYRGYWDATGASFGAANGQQVMS